MTRATTPVAALRCLTVATLLAVLVVLTGPVSPAHAATVPFDLHTATGNMTLPDGVSVPVWGYRATAGAVQAPGGPTLEVTQGDTVEITVHNDLTEPTSLLVQGQEMVPDLDGVGAGGTKTYSFTASHAGTYLYEAGLLPNSQHQVAMGLYGALVVLPSAANQAYADAGSHFDDTAVLVLSEIDPVLNATANPATFDLRKYAPRYFLVNGRAYPDAAPVPSSGGNTVLLRYVNAGLQYHSMGVLGADQHIIALDGSRLSDTRRQVAETFGPGQTADVLVTAPQAGADLTQLAVYDANLLLHNAQAAGTGGMLTTIDVPGTGSTADTAGPVTSAATFTAGTLTATVDDGARGGSDVTAAEYYVDDVTGSGTAMTAVGSFGAPTVDVTASASLGTGDHVVYVRGSDGTHWGPFTSVLVTGADVGGPTVRSPQLTPALTNHSNTGGVEVAATADDTASGNSNIAKAEFFLDAVGADDTGSAMAVTPTAAIADIRGTIDAATVNNLTEGTHVVYIHAQDAQGNWGDASAVPIALGVDITGPDTSGVSIEPNPNNGRMAYNAGATSSVRLIATTMSDPISGSLNSPIKRAEMFIDTAGADGSGIPLKASDGVYNDPSEGGYADIPLSTVAALSDGNHTMFVHAQDAAGNWGAYAGTVLLVDKTGPTVSGLSVTPNPTAGAAQVTLSGTVNDNLSAVTRAEWYVGTDPGTGNGTAMTLSGTGTGPYSATATISTTALGSGTATVRVRAQDALGNWGTPASTTVTVSGTGPAPGTLFYSTLGNTNPPGVTGSADDADIYTWNGTAHSRIWDASANALPGAANVDGYDRVDATHFYLSFAAANTNVPGLGNVQDEDVVYYNNGSWSVYFDGTSHGLTAGGQDLDAITVVGGTLYFSTLGNVNPPGVGGTADDADIYTWNGTAYARVWDATANGLAGAANVDGYSRVDATHFYLSFSPANTTVPTLGAVQDEDVVYRNGTTWSTYFDGTASGLTADAQDVDAFDLP